MIKLIISCRLQTATLIKVYGDVQVSMNTEPFHTRRDDPAEVYRLRISHYSDRDFLDAFRSDLAGRDSRVITLSLFLSPHRLAAASRWAARNLPPEEFHRSLSRTSPVPCVEPT